jgi:hypothetical protein
MYGTIGHLSIKPGLVSKITQYLHDFDKVPGVLKSSLYCIDADSHDYYWTIVWADKKAHDTNASSADFPDRYAQFLTVLNGDPEWYDGECVYSMA